MEIKIKKLNENAVIPSYAMPGDMGMDVVAIDYKYSPEYKCHVYHTGLAFEVPDGYGMLIFPRSSNRKTDAYLCNSVGLLDARYRGELLLCFKNRDKDDYTPPYKVGDKVGQIVIMPYPFITFKEVDELSETERGSGGFGSTGN